MPPGTRKMPEPITAPTASSVRSRSPRVRTSWAISVGASYTHTGTQTVFRAPARSYGAPMTASAGPLSTARLQLGQHNALLRLVLALAVFVADLAHLIRLQEKDLAQSLVRINARGQGSGVRDLQRHKAFPLGLERGDVHDDAAARIGALSHANGQHVAGDLEVFHRARQRERIGGNNGHIGAQGYE